MSSPDLPATVAAPAILVGVDFGGDYFDAELEELGLLAQTAGMQPVARITCKRKAPDAALFVGSGKADEIKALAEAHGATEVLFDQSLSPAQQRNLERHLGLPVNDRTLVILEIFGQRARSHEGKLQVELARLQYLSTRLVRRWSHLERQRGGIGTRGGPGETQIELDRRMIGESIKRTKERLIKVKRQRSTQRRQRERRNTFNISLVGYTNAGKSTLFNRLTGASVMAEDLLFATLDPTMRAIRLPGIDKAIVSDTVGFISDLPTQLVAAFRATLEEVTAADIIVHVRDIANPDTSAQKQQVLEILAELGVIESSDEPEPGASPPVPMIEVWNKWDLLDPDQVVDLLAERARRPDDKIVPLSAVTGEGCQDLRDCLAGMLTADARLHTFLLPAGAGQQLAWLHAHGDVVSDEAAGEGADGPLRRLAVRLSPKAFGRFARL